MEPAKITDAQKTKIWSRAKEIKMDDFTLYDLVESFSGARSVKGLTKSQAIELIDQLEGKVKGTPRLRRKERIPRDTPNVISLATPSQLAYIRDLKEKSGWSDEHLLNFVRKQFKRDSLKKLQGGEPGVLIRVLNHAIKKEKEIA